MARLIYIEASPRKTRSHSIKAAQAFINAWQEANPGGEVDTVDLWDGTLPAFDDDMLNAKYAVMHQQDPTPEQKAAWARITEMAERFKAADVFLFSVPMWNFGIPYAMKQYIDLITQPGMTFTVGENGYEGLVKGKRAVVAYASGGAYGAGSPAESYDQQKPYMRLWLQFIGFTDIHELVVDGTMGDAVALEQKHAEVAKSARAMAGG